MLASITPLGERGRTGHWTITVTAMALGSTAAGAALGALAGLAGELGPVPHQARMAILAVAIAVAIGLDTRGTGRVPGPRRQVDELWLQRYRGWVYGLGYGVQFGLAVTTVVTSAATYVTLLVAVLVADPGRGALILGSYGAIRGLTPLVAARVRTPGQLISLHARLMRVRPMFRRVALAAMCAVGLLAAGLAVA